MANGQKVGWSIDQYLTSLNQKVGALLDAQAKPVGTPPLKSAAAAAGPK
jgi:hypothetical protein